MELDLVKLEVIRWQQVGMNYEEIIKHFYNDVEVVNFVDN